MLDLSLPRTQLIAAGLAAAANFFLFFASITPAWQVAEDTDVNRYVQSGLWLYCPGAAQCWYIFSDNLINYYEKVDVCRFLLIGDCRKKLLRTPYFFGWHYAVLILNVFAMCFLGLSTACALLSYFKKERARIATIVFDILVSMAAIFLTVSLIVFVVNAEMLESKYLIGVKNTFEKQYGYSFYLACLSLLIVTFGMLFAVIMTTFTFFYTPPNHQEGAAQYRADENYRTSQYYQDQPKLLTSAMKEPYHTDGASTVGFQTPMRSITPMSQMPSLNVDHGEYIAGARSPNGDFQPTTRHFYSY